MIRNRLILAFLLPTILLLALMGALLYLEARSSLEAELSDRLIAVAQTTAATLPSGDPRRLSQLEAQDTSTLERLRGRLETVRQATGARRLFLITPRRQSLVDTRPDVRFGDTLFELAADEVELERAFSGQASSSVLFTGADGVPYKNGYAPIAHEGQVVAVLGVEGSASYFTVLGSFRDALLGVLLLALLAVIAVAVLVARSITRPIDVLVEAARRLGGGDLSQDVQMDRRDEFQTLTNAFNEMRADLLARDRQLQMMLSGIAHEVRNPLGGMELFIGLLAEDVAHEPQRLGYVQKITRELRYLGRVVNAFLDYARKKPLEWQRFGARELLEEVTQLQSRELASRQVGLHIQGTDPALELTADREQLHRLLLNLIRNAGQACDPGAQVTVRALEAPRCDLDSLPGLPRRRARFAVCSPSGSSARWRAVIVSDQGQGIPAQKLEAIFEPFFTTKEKGSGLGLALLQKIVDEHGGGLMVSSTARPEEHLRRAASEEELLEGSQAAALLGVEAAAPQGWLGGEGLLGEEGMLGQEEGLLGMEEALVPAPPAPALVTEDEEGFVYGTCMVVLLPFKEELERAKMEIPEGWLG